MDGAISLITGIGSPLRFIDSIRGLSPDDHKPGEDMKDCHDNLSSRSAIKEKIDEQLTKKSRSNEHPTLVELDPGVASSSVRSRLGVQNSY